MTRPRDTDTVRRVLRYCFTAMVVVLAAVSGTSVPAHAELYDDELNAPRVVTQRDWLDLRLSVLGLGLSYPAYRVSLALTDSNRVRFEFWISTPMAQHLSDAGRRQSEKVLSYHATGIQTRVSAMIEGEFPSLWPSFDETADLEGEFLTPADELEEPPERWASWRDGEFEWSWQP